jgi:hypothetical protein
LGGSTREDFVGKRGPFAGESCEFRACRSQKALAWQLLEKTLATLGRASEKR